MKDGHKSTLRANVIRLLEYVDDFYMKHQITTKLDFLEEANTLSFIPGIEYAEKMKNLVDLRDME